MKPEKKKPLVLLASLDEELTQIVSEAAEGHFSVEDVTENVIRIRRKKITTGDPNAAGCCLVILSADVCLKTFYKQERRQGNPVKICANGQTKTIAEALEFAFGQELTPLPKVEQVRTWVRKAAEQM